MQLFLRAAAASLISVALAGVVDAGEKTVTWTGWFSDIKCASARASGGKFTATNPVCAKTCIEKGADPVFVSEQAKAIFVVKGYSSVIDDLGYHLEIHARVDEDAKTLTIQSVKRLAYVGAFCERPKPSHYITAAPPRPQ